MRICPTENEVERAKNLSKTNLPVQLDGKFAKSFRFPQKYISIPVY